MADEKAVERAAVFDDNPNIPNCSARSQPDLNAQGESLFLPYLVEHLRSSLEQQQHHQQQPVPPARRHRQAAQSAAQQPESGRVEDSGTESGEDLRFLAAGLRDSIELHRKGVPQEKASNQGILSEVQSALSRLQSSLRLGCIGTEHVDSSKQNSLLQLIERLQTSLKLPSVGPSWQKHSIPLDLPRSSGSQRFTGRQKKRSQRHTVDVTREELADVRRFLEEAEIRNKISTSSEAAPPDVPSLPVRSYELVKQCSAGDLPFVASQGSAFRPFRPTHFLSKPLDETAPHPHENAECQKSLTNVSKRENTSEVGHLRNVESDDDIDNGDDRVFKEEKAVVGKAFRSENDSANSLDYDPSSHIFSTSQSAHKAATSKQLLVEDERKQENKDIELETSDEDTMTDASYESETEKAESDGYEEEDNEFEEDEVHDERNMRSTGNAKNTFAKAGIVRNSTYTIQPKSVATSRKVLDQRNCDQNQNHKHQDHKYQISHKDRLIQEHSKKASLNDNNKRAHKEPEIRMMHNKAYISSQQLQAQRHEEKNMTHHIQQRNPPPYVHHDVNHKYIEAVKRGQHDERNGKDIKTRYQEHSNNQRHVKQNEDNFRVQQDKNNNRHFEISTAKVPDSNSSHSETKSAAVSVNDSPKAARFANRQLKKQKIKRANTIDIPKPLHYYDVEDESGGSSDGDSQKGNPIKTSDVHKSITTDKSSYNTAENAKLLHGSNTESKRGSHPNRTENKVKQMFMDVADIDNPSYNPQAHGGAQWNSRFANIKTCFENPSSKEKLSPNKKQSDGLNRARSFWRSADDSSLKVSKNSAFHDPKLSKQGSQFLKKLHEQKDQGQPAQKLPWTATEHENIVVGSLLVPANVTKSIQPIQPQVPINKFSHAPMSAFRPIEKKNPASAAHSSWAAPSVTGSVKQIASSKFSLPDPQPPALVHKQEPSKPVKVTINLQALPTAPAPVSPTLPWTKDVTHGHSLNSTLAKFESMSSRESSPQLVPNALLRSQSQDRVSVMSNLTVFNKNVPAPPPRTYMPVPKTNIVQTRAQNLTTMQRQELPFIPEQHPHPLIHSKSNQFLPQGNYYSGPIKNHPLLDGDNNLSDSDDDEPPPSSSRLVLSTLQGNIEQSPVRDDKVPTQTYSAGVTARQSIYGVPVVHQQCSPKPAPMPEENIHRDNYFQPETNHNDFPEEYTAAVTRVMGRPQCQAAVTVSHKTRHCNEEGEGERGSAAFHLASLLHKFSGDEDVQTSQSPNTKELYQSPKQPAPVSSLENWASISLAPVPTSNLPPKPEGSPRLSRAIDAGHSRLAEQRSHNLPVHSDPDRMKSFPRLMERPFQTSTENDDSSECVYASRFEIPVNKVQNIAMKFQSLKESPSEPTEERKPSVSPNPGVVLRKSESWHQLAAQQQGLSRRPQSMVVSELPPVQPRSPNPLHKAKSSHSLAFPKQFEAAIKPEALEKKQKTVEEFFKKGKIETKSNTKSSEYRQTKISQSSKSHFAQSTGMALLDDNIENVDEAFESLFNAAARDGITKFTKASTSGQDAKGSNSRVGHR